MKIRSFLILSFLIATLVPSLIFSLWSYNDSIKREFAEVKDRHLLIAQNLGFALEHYHQDLVTTFESVSASLSKGTPPPGLNRVLAQHNVLRVLNVDSKTGRILQHLDPVSTKAQQSIPPALLAGLKAIATAERTTFTGVMAAPNHQNVIYLVKDRGDHLAVGEITTEFFIALGRSVHFGDYGHAAIVDQFGNVLAHPRADWVANRTNIAEVSAVKRMMNGETGIGEFYSSAFNGNLIAGFTVVKGPGWGVMVPQPVSEIYNKVYQNQSSVFLVLAIGLAITLLLGLFLARALSAPLEKLVETMRQNARSQQLSTVSHDLSVLPFTEVADFRHNYNLMVRRVTKAAKRIETLAYTDSVTGLPNRDWLQAKAIPILETAGKSAPGGVMVLIDLDNFKEINDLHGHDIGDQFLKACGRKLVAIAGRLERDEKVTEPIVARIGGDEFIVMVQGLVEEEKIRTFLDELRLELCKPTAGLTFISNSSASIGCAKFPQHGSNVENLLKCADIAIYHAKNHGKNKSEIYTLAMGTQSVAEIRRDLLEAIANNNLVLEYQPKICARRHQVCGVEALVRWDHPELGRFLPDRWIPAISDSPAMACLGEWVVERAMKDRKVLTEAGYDFFLSVNIGSRHFVAPGFVEALERIREKLDFNPSQLEIEVTEDALFVSEQQAISVFNQLNELGYAISIDDFGKGYSNIARLAQLPVDFLKIDRSIIAGAFTDTRIRAILESTIRMAEKLDCKTVAEGVETLQQAEFATRLGANCLQGNYFAGSMPLDTLIHWLKHQSQNAIHDYHQRLKEAV